MGVSTLHNARGVFGLASAWDRIEEEYGTAAAITEGMVCTLGTTGLCSAAATGATTANRQLVGVALHDMASGASGRFLTKGLAAALVIHDAADPAANDLLTGPVTTAGRAGILTAAATSQGQCIGWVVLGGTAAAGLKVPLAYIQKM